MKQEEILEYNKRCAEFLGWKYENTIWLKPHSKEINTWVVASYSKKFINFAYDWNWIMEVLNKISSLDFGWKVTSKYVNIYSHSGDPRGEFDCKFEMNCPQDVIIDTVKTINQFLIWYNEQRT